MTVPKFDTLLGDDALGLGFGEGVKINGHLIRIEKKTRICAPSRFFRMDSYLTFPDQTIKSMARDPEALTYCFCAHKFLHTSHYITKLQSCINT